MLKKIGSSPILSTASICRIERGEQELTYWQYSAIQELLTLNPDELSFGNLVKSIM